MGPRNGTRARATTEDSPGRPDPGFAPVSQKTTPKWGVRPLPASARAMLAGPRTHDAARPQTPCAPRTAPATSGTTPDALDAADPGDGRQRQCACWVPAPTSGAAGAPGPKNHSGDPRAGPVRKVRVLRAEGEFHGHDTAGGCPECLGADAAPSTGSSGKGRRTREGVELIPGSRARPEVGSNEGLVRPTESRGSTVPGTAAPTRVALAGGTHEARKNLARAALATALGTCRARRATRARVARGGSPALVAARRERPDVAWWRGLVLVRTHG